MLICPHCESGEVRKRGTRGEDPIKQIIQCNSCGAYSSHEVKDTGDTPITKFGSDLREVLKRKRFIVTSAQNNTAVHAGFWGAILAYAKARDASIIVLPSRYRNPTSVAETKKQGEEIWWPKQVEPFLMEQEVEIGDTAIMGHVRVQATAVNPLTGLDPMIKGRTGIFGHAQIAMIAVPAPQYERPNAMWTTGSCSLKNYSDTKAGVKAEFHHSLGAVVIEKSPRGCHVRGVVADDSGGFYDLDRYYGPGSLKSGKITPGKVGKPERALALITGDEHAVFMTDPVKSATYMRDDSLAKICRPQYRIRHDVLDSYAISHHHRTNTVTRYVKWKTGMDSMEGELQKTVDFINETSDDNSINVVVASNHHDHLLRWLNEADPKAEPWNAILYHELMLAVLRKAEMTQAGAKTIDPFPFWATDKMVSETIFLERNESFTVGGVEVCFHGDVGPNGARGSVKNFAKLGPRTVIGHSHRAGIEKGCYQVGASHTEFEYHRGPGSHTVTHCLIHPNGKRQLVTVLFSQSRGTFTN